MLTRPFMLLFSLFLAGLFILNPGTAKPAENEPSHNPDPAPVSSGVYPSEDAYQFPLSCEQNNEGQLMCMRVHSGEIRSTYTISNPNRVSGFKEIQLVNFEQRLLRQAEKEIDIEIISRIFIDTRSPYPVVQKSLPPDVLPALLPSSSVQSDHPEIRAQAQALVAGSRTQYEAVELIISWVRANISYDFTFSLKNDAVSVFTNRSGTCTGFSNVTAALLRAAGIPAQVHSGCVTKWGWNVGDGGGRHAWVQVYYPDIGWVMSDPQTTINFLDASHILNGFDQCGQTGTFIDRTSNVPMELPIYSIRHDIAIGSGKREIRAAQITNTDRIPLKLTPANPTVMLDNDEPFGALMVTPENKSCEYYNSWSLSTEIDWLSPKYIISTTAEDPVVFAIDASGLPNGIYTGTIRLNAYSDNPWVIITTPPRTYTVTLIIVDEILPVFLPVVSTR